MKIDKDALIKHHFWLLFCGYPLFVLIAVILIWSSGDEAIAANKKKQEEKKSALKAPTVTNPYSQKNIQELSEQLKILDKQKVAIWKKSWEQQEPIFKWPEELRTLDGKYFGDEIDIDDRNKFPRDNVYRMLFAGEPLRNEPEGLVAMIRPTEFAGGWENVLTFVRAWEKLPPSKDDMWLAMEDYWVQRELLDALRQTNSLVAQLKEVNADKNPVNNRGLFQKQFRSNVWELDLKLTNKGPDNFFSGTLKNITNQRLPVGRVLFRVYMRGERAQPAWLYAEAEYVGAGKSIELKEQKVNRELSHNGDNTPIRVEQVLDERSVPIKRLVTVQLRYPSSRSATKELQKPDYLTRAAATPPGAPGAPPGAPGAPPVPPGAPPAPPGSPLMGGGAPAPAEVTTNGLPHKRYLNVTAQVRRMPVAMVVVMDQAYLQDLTTALANCRLRLQITQQHWVRYRGPLGGAESTNQPPAMAAPPMGPAAGPLAGGGGRGLPGGRGEGAMPPMAAPPPPPMGNPETGGTSSLTTLDADQPNNLIELSVYGTLSLHERYPPRPATTGTPGTPAPGAPPVPPGAPMPPAGR
jgi:hypothetical protein